ncbi:inhibitor of apoptosis protein [Heliothis zea nudivirus]|uniref:Inhibitor of apoptosis protein n=2 Tax=Betanudivirus hezeae TaxID=3052000 RepID=G9I041_HZNV2|nr:inhibitor of apoptosis protein [Heliothis zea nudivirus]YP_004956763.1 orf15 gene product [Helicoverpa zea nudivirus 2]AAN04427.1 inhibitor of apoptosis protein [Heliothis zea nudivirus]AEW69564.1 inhibitor of apoptosis protein [Helicoverpa zea nudivirus 2]WCZ68495.1 inhibitor of apoptosis protein [Heliothis virescens nudivirus]
MSTASAHVDLTQSLLLYRNITTRLKSFSRWPVGLQQCPVSLAEAGFFYSNMCDEVQCYLCGVRISKWLPEDDPWIQHAKCSKNCRFLLRIKGVDFVYNITKNSTFMHKTQSKANFARFFIKTAVVQDTADRQGECLLCCSHRADIVILPCKHLVSCGWCVTKQLDKCPMCRGPTAEIMKIYF